VGVVENAALLFQLGFDVPVAGQDLGKHGAEFSDFCDGGEISSAGCIEQGGEGRPAGRSSFRSCNILLGI
jgi:hypothetical protein